MQSEVATLEQTMATHLQTAAERATQTSSRLEAQMRDWLAEAERVWVQAGLQEVREDVRRQFEKSVVAMDHALKAALA